MIFDHFDRIRVINLPHRTDRRREMEREFARVGRVDDLEFFPAIAPESCGPFVNLGHHGCYLSHLAVLREAAGAGESVLILEDDCRFLHPEIMTYGLSDSVDVFYGGWLTASNPDDLPNSDIVGSHFMGFSPRAAKAAAEYLTALLDPSFPPDQRAAKAPDFRPGVRPPIDGAYVWFRRAHPELSTEFAMLATQRPSRTDIGKQRWFDRVPVLRDIAGLIRQVSSVSS